MYIILYVHIIYACTFIRAHYICADKTIIHSPFEVGDGVGCSSKEVLSTGSLLDGDSSDDEIENC